MTSQSRSCDKHYKGSPAEPHSQYQISPHGV